MAKENKKTGTNEIFVGNKPFMKYVIATLMQLKGNNDGCAVIKARGKFISRAVDIAEVVKKKIKETENIALNNAIDINTENFQSDDGKDINISTISIELKK